MMYPNVLFRRRKRSPTAVSGRTLSSNLSSFQTIVDPYGDSAQEYVLSVTDEAHKVRELDQKLAEVNQELRTIADKADRLAKENDNLKKTVQDLTRKNELYKTVNRCFAGLSERPSMEKPRPGINVSAYKSERFSPLERKLACNQMTQKNLETTKTETSKKKRQLRKKTKSKFSQSSKPQSR